MSSKMTNIKLLKLKETYGSGKVERYDKTPFYQLEYRHRRIFSNRIKNYSVEEICVKMVMDSTDKEFYLNFLLTYYLVKLSPSQLLQMLIDFYNHPSISFTDITPEARQSLQFKSYYDETLNESDVIRENIIFILSKWITSFYDFYDFPKLKLTTKQFSNDLLQANESNDSNNDIINNNNNHLAGKHHLVLKELLFNFKISAKPYYQILKSSNSLLVSQYTPILNSKISLLTIAQQITLIEYNLTRNVRGRELLSPYDKNSTYLAKYLSHFKKMRTFLIEEFLKEESTKGCSRLIKRAVKLAHICLSLNNFNTPMEILSALFSPIMLSDKNQSWEFVSAKAFDLLVTVSDHLSPDNNYEKYKSSLTSNPSVPFLGVHIGDVQFLHHYNRTHNIEGISTEKLNLISLELKQLSSIQRGKFAFADDIDLQNKILSNLIVVGEKEFEKVSTNIIVPSIKGESERLSNIAQRYANFISDSSLLGREEVVFTDYLLKPRDWVLLSTHSTTQTYLKGDLILAQNSLEGTGQVYLLLEGSVNLYKSNTFIKTISNNAILGETVMLDTFSSNNPEVIAESEKCIVAIVEKSFIVSLLESDHSLSFRFFSSIAFQLIDQMCATADVKSPSSHSQSIPLSSSAHPLLKGNYVSQNRLPVVVKPTATNVNTTVLDPRTIRDREVRSLFNWTESDVIIKESKATMLGRTMNAQGTLFITQNYIGFFSKVFRHEKKVSISFADILKISKKKHKIVIDTKKKRFAVKLKSDEEETFILIEGIMESTDQSAYNLLDNKSKRRSFETRQAAHLSTPQLPTIEKHHAHLDSWVTKDPKTKGMDRNIEGLSESDWALLLRGSKRINFKKNDVVIYEGEDIQRVFQVTRGSCHIEKRGQKRGEKGYILGTIGTGEIFAEISFVLRKCATASVISDSDDLEVVLIEGFYLKRLFEIKREIAGKFMHYMCTVVQKRLGNREWFEDQEERRVVDIITEPLHTNLIKIPAIPLDPLSSLVHSNIDIQISNDNTFDHSIDDSDNAKRISIIDINNTENNTENNNNNNDNNNNNSKENEDENGKTKIDRNHFPSPLSLNNFTSERNENDIRIVHMISGPKDKEEDEYTSWIAQSRPFCSAISISTYPMQTIRLDNGEEGGLKRDGSPICDQYKGLFYSKRAILAIADGCNWGEAPRNAAIAARDAFIHYLHRHSHEITDLHVAGNLILRAFSLAQSAIISHSPKRSPRSDSTDHIDSNGGDFGGLDGSDIGTTTLLGGIVLQLYADPDDPDLDLDLDGVKKSWGFVYGSVGDCKAFHCSAATGKFSDITEGNRSISISASDCGGRLGPQLPGMLPDLRNFELGFFPCDPGDLILLVSDGVHDNLDPALLGFAPRDVNIDSDEWNTLSPEVAENAKIQFRLSLLEKIITNQILSSKVDEIPKSNINNDDDNDNDNDNDDDRSSSISKLKGLDPQAVVRSLIKYCVETCAPSATWMQNNPNKRLPKDYRLYPGKMDHTTVLCYVVGEI